MITLHVDSDHATPEVMKRLHALAESYAANDPVFSGAVIEIEKGDYSDIEDDSGMGCYDLQRFFNDAMAIIQEAQA